MDKRFSTAETDSGETQMTKDEDVRNSLAYVIDPQTQLKELLAALPQRIRTRTPQEVVIELVAHLERNHLFPQTHYAFGEKLFIPRLIRMVETLGKHWVGPLPDEVLIQWEGPWRSIKTVADQLRHDSPQSFREAIIQSADGISKAWYVFTRSLRLGDYGRKRIVIAYDTSDLSGAPLYLFTDALYWEGSRIVQMWQYRWEERMFLDE
jgi:hypothetical protein